MQEKRIALVTGANQGIGLQIAKDLAAKGIVVLVGSRNLENGKKAASEVGASAHAVQLDVTDQKSIAAAAQRIEAEFGYLDILVNNAGISKIGHPQGQSKRSSRAENSALPGWMIFAPSTRRTCSASSR